MNYYDRKIREHANKAHSRLPIFGMGLRIILLISLLFGGKFACEWGVEKAINHPPEEWEVRRYKRQSFLKETEKGRKFTSEELDSLHKNAERDFIRER